MEIYVYADLLFAINFCMNFIIIRLTGKLFGRSCRLWRAAAGAVLAAFVYVFFFVLGFSGIAGVLLGAVGILGGVGVAFSPFRVKEFAALAFGTYVITALIGGGSMAAYNMLLRPGSPDVFVLWTLAMSAVFVYIAVRYVVGRARRANAVRHVAVNVQIKGVWASFTAFVDTGHNLREPISGKPVIVAEFTAIKPLLPAEIARLFGERRDADAQEAAGAFTDAGFANRFRLLPLSTISNQNGLLIGIRPDNARIEAQNREVIVAIFNGELCPEKTYQALVAPEVL